MSDRVFVIAEAGSNWRAGSTDRDRDQAHALIDAAARAGADAVKFQTFRAKDTYVPDAGASDYLSDSGIRRPINDVFADLEMPYEMLGELAAYCESAGIELMSSAFSVADAQAVDPHVVRHKVASYEINHVRLLQYLSRTGKPLIMSTGAATVEEIQFGVDTVREAGATNLTLMQCTARYPAPPDSLNVRAIPWLRQRFGVPTGLSDHSLEPLTAPVAAVALGATAIEKHFTLDRTLSGPDHGFAIEPDELRAMVRAIRSVESALGDEVKAVAPEENELRRFAVRAVQATVNLRPGDALIEGVNFDILRPGKRTAGMHPRHVAVLSGRRVARPIAAGDGIGRDDVDPPVRDSRADA